MVARATAKTGSKELTARIGCETFSSILIIEDETKMKSVTGDSQRKFSKNVRRKTFRHQERKSYSRIRITGTDLVGAITEDSIALGVPQRNVGGWKGRKGPG